MRFRSLRMKLTLDIFKRTVAILGYGDFEIDNDRPLCLLYGGSGLLFLHQLFGHKCRQHISCKGLSLGARRGRWFLSLLETRPSSKRIRKSFSLIHRPSIFTLDIVERTNDNKNSGGFFHRKCKRSGGGERFLSFFLALCARCTLALEVHSQNT